VAGAGHVYGAAGGGTFGEVARAAVFAMQGSHGIAVGDVFGRHLRAGLVAYETGEVVVVPGLGVDAGLLEGIEFDPDLGTGLRAAARGAGPYLASLSCRTAAAGRLIPSSPTASHTRSGTP
jgi:hypothetical protein